MNAEICVAIITSLGSLAGVIITVIIGNKKTADQSKKQTEVTLYRIGELEKKQDRYNHLQERTWKDEQDIAVIKEDIKAIRERMDYLHGERKD